MEPYNTQNTNRGAPDLKAGARGLDTRYGIPCLPTCFDPRHHVIAFPPVSLWV